MKIKNLTLELMVEDIEKSFDFYHEIFEFIPIVKVPEDKPFFMIMKNNFVQVMLYQRKKFTEEIPQFKNLKLGGSIAIYLEIENIENVFEKIKDKVKMIQEMRITDYGTSEFSFEDINGYVWMLSQKN